ncbi:MAG: efflux RND transporter periplasmic adaptor subunit [Ignavibacteriaceae bacterium]|nr:efflux RND transporter periplasmic adaptor subunit [Ignavibacteriaceae bacterium]
MFNYRYIFTFITLSMLFFTIGCGNKNRPEIVKDKIAYADTISVETTKVEKKDIVLVKTYSASLEGEEQANIISKIPERIIKINVKVGDYVSKGSVIISIDKSGASSQYYQAQAAYLNSQKDKERMKALYQEGAVSQQMLDGAQTQFEVNKANFEAAKSTVELTTPLSGIVTAVNANVGDLANPGVVLAVIANSQNMKAVFSVGENDVPGFYVGQPANVYSELKPDLIKNGKIVQISRSANVQSRTFEMKALFSNTADKWFKPGMFCRVNVDLKNLKGTLAIPYSSVIMDNYTSVVFVVKDGKASLKNIKTGITDGKLIEVLSGLNEGDVVVTLGMNKLKDGIIVRVSDKY